MTVVIPPRAGQLIERLAGVAAHYSAPDVDRAIVEDAIKRHLQRLGVNRLPVQFVDDLATGHYSAARAALADDAWVGAWRATWRAARREAWNARMGWSTARRFAQVSARRTIAIESWQRLRGLMVQPSTAAPMQKVADWAADQALCDAMEVAVDVVGWHAEPKASSAIDRWIALVSPLVDALESGLWLCWMTPCEVLVFLRPAVRFENGRLHCEDGPALTWPSGQKTYFWRGVHVPEEVVLSPLDITAQDVIAEPDVEVRRVMLERYGPERFVQDIGAAPFHADETGELYRHELQSEDDEPLCMVRVRDGTPEPDGTRRAYWLRVPPTVQTAREAVAWTFGMEASRYRPDRET